MSARWQKLYRTQDWVLDVLRSVEHGFHLTGGTALSRGCYNHRYSEDLDILVNDRDRFQLWRGRCLNALNEACRSRSACSPQIVLREARFGRAFVRDEADLKLEFINDVPSRVGEPVPHPTLGLLYTKENILANKITALVDRSEPKDAADIFWLCCKDDLSIESAFAGAEGKAAGIFAPLVAKRLAQAADFGVPEVHWIDRPTEQEFVAGTMGLADTLLCL